MMYFVSRKNGEPIAPLSVAHSALPLWPCPTCFCSTA